MVAAPLDLIADRSLTYQETIVFLGDDFTGAAYAMKIRPQPDATGTALVSLATVTDTSQGIKLIYAGSATIAAHVAAGRLQGVPVAVNPSTGIAYTSADTVALSQLQITITNTTMAGMPPAAETGDDLELAYDLVVTPSGGFGQKRLAGSFIIHATATQ